MRFAAGVYLYQDYLLCQQAPGTGLVSTLDNYFLAIYNLDKVKGMINSFSKDRCIVEM